MLRYYSFILVFFILIYSCKSFQNINSNEYTVLKYIAPTAKSNYEKENILLVKIPKNGRISKSTSKNHITDVEYRVIYPDSTLLYITNSYFYGGELNLKNRIHSGIGGYHRNSPFDTLRNQGVQKNGLFWKEYVLGDIAVGYLNVKEENKLLFDKSIESARWRNR